MVADAGDLHRVLEGQEHAFAGAIFRIQLQQILALEGDFPSVTSYSSRPASVADSVLLPEPFGPMMACTSPGLISRSNPLRISLPSTLTFKFLMLNMLCPQIAPTALKCGD